MQVIVEHLEYLRYPGAYSTGYKLEDEKYPLLVLSSQYLSKYGKLKFLDEELRDIPFLSQELNKTIENSVKAQEFGFSQNEGDTNFELLIALCVLAFPIFSIFLLLFSVFPFQVFINTLTVSIILGFVIFFISQFLGPMIESFVLIYLGNDDLYLFAGLGITTYLCVIVYLSYYYFSKKPDKVFFRYPISFLFISSPATIIIFLAALSDASRNSETEWVRNFRKDYLDDFPTALLSLGIIILIPFISWFLYQYQSRPKIT